MDEFRVYFVPTYPAANPNCSHFPTLRESSRCIYPGKFLEIVVLLAQAMNVSLVPVTETNLHQFYPDYDGHPIVSAYSSRNQSNRI